MATPVDTDFLRAFAETRGFLLGRPTRVRATADGRAVLFLRSEARSATHDLFELDVTTGTTRVLVRASELADAGELSEAEKARRERQRITDTGFVEFHVSPDGQRILLPLGGRLWLWERARGKARPLLDESFDGVLDARLSPDGARVAFVFAHDLWVLDLLGPARAPLRITRDGHATRFHGQAEFVAQEEMGRHSGCWFSADGRFLAFTVVDESAVETFTIADPARPEAAPAQFRYPRAGRGNAEVRLVVVEVPSGGPVGVPCEIAWDRDSYPYLARVSWAGRPPEPRLLVQSRDQREAVLLAGDPRSGETRALFREHDPDWVNLEGGLPLCLADGSGILAVSESSGQRVLQLRSWDGAFLHDVVGGDRGFLSLISVDLRERTALVLEGDALRSRLCRVSLTGDGRHEVLLDDGGDHQMNACEDGSILVDQRVATDAWPEVRVLDRGGRRLLTLPDAAEAPPFAPNLEYHRLGEDGCHAVIVRPRAAVAGLKYPVVVHVYGGPHSLMVRADRRHYLLDQWIADQGVIVVAIDNRGTPRRGRAWERAIKGSFAQGPLDDQVEGLHRLAAVCPEMDLGRVGIYGWSFGGYMASLAVLRRPEVFKVAVAGAPVVDWRDYDTHYTERYLDLPDRNPEGYRESSLLSHASGLSRPLLLVHGTADDNVYFFHSLKLADALLRAGRRFDFLPLPRVTHQIGDAELRRRVWFAMVDYLLRHL